MDTSSFVFFFLLICSLSPGLTDIVKKTTEDVTKDDDIYYKYNVEYIPIHWDQFWIDTNSFIPIPASKTNFSVELPFTFNFYGHPVSKIFIFPSGYISTTIEDDEHSTKYIAPMKANLDPHHDKTAGLSYWVDKRNSSVTVEWKNAIVKDIPSRAPFTFRAKIWSSGLIEFTYQYLGIDLAHLLPSDRDFKIGIGDSIKSFGMVYNYHSVDIPKDMIQDKTKVTLRPLPTCTTRSSCEECVQGNLDFHCFWCPAVRKCVSGIDFHRAEYANENCPKADSLTICKSKHPFLPVKLLNITEETALNDGTEITSTHSSSMSIETTEVPVTETMPTIKTLVNETSDISTSIMDNTSNPSSTSPLHEVVTEKNYLYYNVTLVLEEEKSKNLWVDMEDTTAGRIKTSSLSVSRMQAHQLKLHFPFPFFGNKKTKLSFTGDGFISTMNSWMIHDKTHFIAPLKGLFDQKYSSMVTSVKYKTTSRTLTIQWSTTKYRYHSVSNYVPFVFQATLHSNGDIDFVYKNFGNIENSSREYIGLSEGYSEEMKLGFLIMPNGNPIRYQEHHNINLTDMKDHLTNWTALQIKALPTCSDQANCADCLSMPDISGFKCAWCSTANLCRGSNEPSGEDWVVRNCYLNMVHQRQECPKKKENPTLLKGLEYLTPDDHKYYNSVMLKSEESFGSYFVNFTTLNASSVTDMWKTSNNFLTADPYTLSFLFPFYGHPIQDIMILSGGFISLASSPSNRNILEHEYIAPLMADLDASYSKQARIQVYEQDNAFNISWRNVRLLSQEDTEPLSFQLTLMSNGTIVFCYEDIPEETFNMILSSDLNIIHSVRIGLSDSFAYDAKKLFTNKTSTKLYKYHELDLKSYAAHIQSRTAILLEPLPTCNSFSSCSTCLTADPQLNCVWCSSLEFCSDGMDRKRKEWDAERCYLSHIGLRTADQCPLEIKTSNEQFYKQTMHHQKLPLMGRPHKSFFLNLNQEQNYFPVKLPFTFPYFEEEVTYITISSHGLIGMSTQPTTNDSSDPIVYKYVAPFKYNLMMGKDSTINHGELGVPGAECYVVEWDNFKFYDDQLVSFKCALCSDGTIYFYYTNMANYALLELENLGVHIGLWHGVARDGAIDMAVEQVDISRLKQVYTVPGLVVQFSPLTPCSLSPSCLSSPDCPFYVTKFNCSRFSCQALRDPLGMCPVDEVTIIKSLAVSTAGGGVAVLGVVGGVLLVCLLVGVLVFGIKRMDTRPGQWQTIQSVFQPGYQIFRSGEDIGSREIITEEDNNEIRL